MITQSGTRGPGARGVPLVAVLIVLALVSGMIDAVSFLELHHVFTANMTGNVIVLGFAAAGAQEFSVPHTTTSLACFLVGAVSGGRMLKRMGGRPRRTRARAALAAEAAPVGTAAVVALAVPATGGVTYALIGLTAFAMGLRNATVRKLAVPGLATTTVVTMTLTGLAAESPLGSGSGGRIRRRAALVVALFTGASAGAWLALHRGPGLPLLVAALLVAALAVTVSGQED
ncbi:YoaK family protein [Streptomyces actuosus]|nr:YoaK family protein [Streptomyces actuosus]